MEQPVKLHVVVWSLLAEVFFNVSPLCIQSNYKLTDRWLLGIDRTSHTKLLDLQDLEMYDYEVLVVNGKVLLVVIVLVLLVRTLLRSFFLSKNKSPNTQAYAIISLIHVQTFQELSIELRGLSVTVNVLIVVGDLLIASILTYLLQRCKTGFKRTNTMINKLMILAINTGVITSLCAISSLISFLAAPNAFIYISFFFSMGRLYTNSLLTSLNCRRRIREAGNIGATIGEVGNYSSKSPKTFNVSIQVETAPEFVSSYGIFQSDNEVEVGPKVLEDDLSDGARSFPV
ncbi:hypothetical protein GG344DRAFT_67690 [Lentinula edodes]|nr:hypothetical protein GG344DRAFT_67690 [Lentinula edodes]